MPYTVCVHCGDCTYFFDDPGSDGTMYDREPFQKHMCAYYREKEKEHRRIGRKAVADYLRSKRKGTK